MGNIKIALFEGRGPLSSLIRWKTGSKYSHAAVVTQNWSMIESWQGAGVRRKILKDWKNGVTLFEIKNIEIYQERMIIEFLESQIGCGYDYLGVLGVAMNNKNFSNKERWFCSEIIFAALEYAGIVLLENTQANEFVPDFINRSPLLSKIKI